MEPGKGFTFSTGEDEKIELQAGWAKSVGSVKEDFVHLGVHKVVEKGASCCSVTPLRAKAAQRCQRQLTRIGQAIRQRARRKVLIRKLIIPKVKFGGAWVQATGVKKLALSLERCVGRGKLWAGRAPALEWMVDLGAD